MAKKRAKKLLTKGAEAALRREMILGRRASNTNVVLRSLMSYVGEYEVDASPKDEIVALARIAAVALEQLNALTR